MKDVAGAIALILAAIQFIRVMTLVIERDNDPFCGVFPLPHDLVEFYADKGVGSHPDHLAVYSTCRRCKRTIRRERIETADEFEARQPKGTA